MMPGGAAFSAANNSASETGPPDHAHDGRELTPASRNARTAGSVDSPTARLRAAAAASASPARAASAASAAQYG